MAQRIHLDVRFSVLFALCLAGCDLPGDPEVVGHSGVSRGEDGRLIGHVIVCDGSVDTATFFGPGNPAPTIARWAASEPASGYVRLDPASPPIGWTLTSDSVTSIESDESYFFKASSDDGYTVLVSVGGAELETSDGEILAWDGQRDAAMTEAEFKQLCD